MDQEVKFVAISNHTKMSLAKWATNLELAVHSHLQPYPNKKLEFEF